MIVVTNQSGIGRGIFEESSMHAIHEAIQFELSGAIDAFYFCPHLPCGGCKCRKPDTGMIEAAMADFDIDQDNSWIVGDKKIDVETGLAAQIRSALVLTGYGQQHQKLLEHAPNLVGRDLEGVVGQIVS